MAADDRGYVRSSTCAGCHENEHDLWRNSHHDLAMQPAIPGTVLGDFGDTTFDYFGTTSTFYRDGDTYYVRTDGPDGELADYPIAYTFGVEPLQQYLIEMPGGRLQALGVVWDTRPKSAGGQRWYHLYPDEPVRAGDELHWTGLNQNWNFMCADCHSTNLQKNYDLETDTYATTWNAIDVGCEACHGPGQQHVDAMEAEDWGQPFNGFELSLSRAESKVWAIDPETGSPPPESAGPEMQPELEVCAQCHSRRATQFHGARPEDGLFNHFLPSLLEEGLYHVDGQVANEVYVYGSFLQSAMYHAGVTCSDCHNPHSLARKAEGNALCGQCHQASRFDTGEHHGHPEDSAGAECVACHMPDATFMGVDERQAHSFRIPRPDLSVSLGVPNVCIDCHQDKDDQWAADSLRQRHGEPSNDHFADALHAGRYGGPQAEQKLARLIQDTSQPAIARATAASLLPRYLSQRTVPVLQQASQTREPLVALGVAQGLTGIPEQYRAIFGIPGLYDEHRIPRSLTASNLSADTLPSEQPEVSRRHADAMEEYIQSQRNNADRPESLVNLAGLYGQQGQFAKAEGVYRTAIKRVPYYTAAYVNLADLLRARGRDAEGRQVLESALGKVNDPASIEHSLGLLLVRQQQLDPAIKHLGSAAGSDTAPARYVYVYAVALDSQGRTEDAIAELESATGRYPGNREILSALVSFLRKQGQANRAAAYEQQLRDQ
ncbi:tetratricopeptide repeat protein [Marinobacter sp. LN3S78]|uniref:tetratricopeptide repeat protein n=1 Tax=Marinobacter sp. LN3S78 TaxID=3382300 RepID=UPI00387AC0CD